MFGICEVSMQINQSAPPDRDVGTRKTKPQIHVAATCSGSHLLLYSLGTASVVTCHVSRLLTCHLLYMYGWAIITYLLMVMARMLKMDTPSSPYLIRKWLWYFALV